MSSGASREIIKVLIVDDIPDTRENIRKLLAFEADIQVVGMAGTGREAVRLATETRPDVVLMDINMPDMDGITATKAISTAVRTAAVVIMSVQSEPGYLRQAMLAGARDYLTKPIASEELYSTIRRVYERNEPIRQQEAAMGAVTVRQTGPLPKPAAEQLTGAGHVIVVYSPQGGVGVTTIATNIAAALMRPDTRVLLIDCDLQFGDVDAFLNLQAQSTISDLTKVASDIDRELIENVLLTHGSGLCVLAAPTHPEHAYDISTEDLQQVSSAASPLFDCEIVDTPAHYDDNTLKLFEMAERIVLVAVPTIPSVRNTRKMLEIFDNLQKPAKLSDKIVFALNRTVSEKERGRGTVPAESIASHLNIEVAASIPLDERAMLTSVNQGVPLVAKQKSRSPGRELVELAELLRKSIEAEDESPKPAAQPPQRSKSGLRALFGGTG